jgi:hypothetical protein
MGFSRDRSSLRELFAFGAFTQAPSARLRPMRMTGGDIDNKR